LASLGGGALVIAGVMTMKRSEPPAESKVDPLAALVQKAKNTEQTAPEEVDEKDVTFPAVLSDHSEPTTALAAVKDERGRLVDRGDGPKEEERAPVPAADRLPVVPLPVGTLLSSTPVTTKPKDGLTALAHDVSRVSASAEETLPGVDGGFQIQVASFRAQPDADAFVAELRKRGHRAFRQAAYVPDRGLWHRVRIGPFKSKFSAQKYAADFEASEHMNTFVVDPDKVKRQEDIRRAKAAARKEKYGTPE
jgi:cell division septation protein DedD